jgi:hypothetical protein
MDNPKQENRKDVSKTRKRHRGVGREGLRPGERVEPQGDKQGLGHEGVDRDRQNKDRHREPERGSLS